MKDNDYKGEIYYSEPKLNSDTNLYEVLKTDEEGNVLDIIQDENEDKLKERVEEELKTNLLSKINKKDKPKQKRNKKSNVSLSESRDQIIIDILELKLKGEQINDILNKLSFKYSLTKANIALYVQEAMRKVRELSQDKLEQTIENHVGRYETIYNWLYENGFNSHLRKVLLAKENLLSVGSEIVINFDANLFDSKTEGEFIKNKISLLEVNSQQKLLSLLSKIKYEKKEL